MLYDSAKHARYIRIPQWRDQALLIVVNHASSSDQFARGIEIARSIPRSEIRTDALILIAEGESNSDFLRDSSETYQEAARAVASIPLDDPRSTLNGVLIDSLVTVGRFEDARKCIVFYPDSQRRNAALGAIAESMGRRGLADKARDWIAKEVPEGDQSMLYRRVLDGVLAEEEQTRSQSAALGSRR